MFKSSQLREHIFIFGENVKRGVMLLKTLAYSFGEGIGRGIVKSNNIKGNDLQALKTALDAFLKSIPEYKSMLSQDKLVATSKCTIHKLYKKWCEQGCEALLQGFCSAINEDIHVKRVEKAPESEFCRFEFTL